MDISLVRQLKCAERELAKRHKHYPSWIRQGRLRRPTAEREIAEMTAIIATLQRLVMAETMQQGELFAHQG